MQGTTNSFQNLLKEGSRHFSGLEEAIMRNIEACIEISHMTRTSLGPMGMNKIVITHIDKIIVTSDAATILGEVDVHHPAAKMLQLAAKTQESEVGDGTNFVIILGGELMHQAESLLKMGLHPSDILLGYEKASTKTIELLETLATLSIKDVRSKIEVLPAIRSVVMAKQYGDEDILAPLIVEACHYSMPRDVAKFDVDHVRIAKILGGTLSDSRVIRGMIALRAPETQGVTKVENAKVAVYNCPLEAETGDTKGTVLLRSAEELKNYTKGEENHMEEFIKSIKEAGVRVIVAGGSVSDMALHFIEKYEMMCVKILSKFQLRRFSRSLGAIMLVRHGAPTAEEMGYVDACFVQEIGSQKCTIFRREEEGSCIGTILLRGPTNQSMDDCERAIDDGVNTIRTICKDPRFLPGAGATEIHLAHLIHEYAKTQPGLDQYAIEKFGDALEIIPQTLAENAGHKVEELIAKLYAETIDNPKIGLDIEEAKTVETEIMDSYESKHWGIKLATDAVLTILKVDQIIMSKPAGGPAPTPPQMGMPPQ